MFIFVVLLFASLNPVYASSEIEGLSDPHIKHKASERLLYVKDTLKQLVFPCELEGGACKTEVIKNHMAKHYERLRLLRNGVWQSEQLKEAKETLLPESVSKESCMQFIEKIEQGIEHNPLAVRFLAHMPDALVQRIKEKTLGGKDELADILAYGMVMSKTTSLIMGNVNALEEIHEIWRKESKNISLISHFNLFECVKYIGLVQADGFRPLVKTGKVAPGYLSLALPVNILEAAVTDYWLGNKDNAYAGWILAKNGPTSKEDPRTGAGPAYTIKHPDKNGFRLQLRAPYPKAWADLYTMWNLGFVSTYSNWPYFMCKLLIPEVSHYQENPCKYMGDRFDALCLHAYAELFRRHDEKKHAPKQHSYDWIIPELTTYFGEFNAASARNYQRILLGEAL